MGEPIIRRLLDRDFYKDTMGQLVWLHHPEVPVTYQLLNRTPAIRLADLIAPEAVREQLDYVRTLTPTDPELDFLANQRRGDGKPLFQPGYLDHLRSCCLPDYELKERDGQFALTFFGSWQSAIYWETTAMAIIRELETAARQKRMTVAARHALRAEGEARLAEKIRALRDWRNSHGPILIADFGARRRFSRTWHRHVLERLQEAIPDCLLGTSDTWLALELGLQPIGTMAHELFMVGATLVGTGPEELRRSPIQMMEEWEALYGADLTIALPDTFGTAAFFRDWPTEMARRWRGTRHDSGDPVAYGEERIRDYRHRGIDPTTKLIVFSNSLRLSTILELERRFAGQIRTAYGWGEGLMNDLGLTTASIVVKVIEANGQPTVKLSDDEGKELGPLALRRQYRAAFPSWALA